MPDMRLSIIIPTWCEADNLARLLPHLQTHGGAAVHEIIVCDADSPDGTRATALAHGAVCPPDCGKGRAVQMNAGARHATGDVLYFVHADVLPPSDYVRQIEHSIRRGNDLGCFSYRFDRSCWRMRFNAYCTRFGNLVCRGGDQTLYVKREVFDALDGYDEYYTIMEDYDFVRRARERYRFDVMDAEAVVSARKYDTNSYLRVQLANATVMGMYLTGRFTPSRMKATYRRMLDYRFMG